MDTSSWWSSLLFFFLTFNVLLIETAADVDNSDSRPHVAWVPIVQRNVSDTVSNILDELNERPKLQRIGVLLNNSYVKLDREAEEGERVIKSLEDRIHPASVSSRSSCIVTSHLTTVLILISNRL